MSFESFSRVAEAYDKWYEENKALYLKELECVRSAVEGKCLEVGAGTGAFCSKLSCIALEPSLEMLKLAKDKGCEAVRGVAEALPFRSSSFRTALFVTSLCFVQDQVKALEEAKRVGEQVVSCILVKGSELVREYERKGQAGHPIYKHAKFLTGEGLGDKVCGVGNFFACFKFPSKTRTPSRPSLSQLESPH